MPSKVPEGWQVTPISSLLAWDSPGFWGDEPGGASPSVKVLRSTNFTDGGRLDLGDIAERVFPERVKTAKRLRAGDLLLERSGGGPNKPVGRVCLFEEQGEYFYSNFIQGLRCRPEVDHRFAFYLLWHLHNAGTTRQFQQATTGIRNLAYTDYLAWSLSLPPLPEQTKIAAILSSVDEAIQLTQRVIDQTRRVKEGLLQDLLTRGLPGHTRFKRTEIGEIPAAWETRTLGEISILITKGATPTTYGHPFVAESEAGAVRFLRGANAGSDGQFDSSDCKYISAEADSMLSRSRLEDGDSVIVIVGTVGNSFLVATHMLPANISQNVAVIRGDRRVILPGYLSLFLQSEVVARQLRAEATTQAQPSLSLQQLRNLTCPLPGLNEQNIVTQRVNEIDSVLIRSHGELRSLSLLKSGLLQDLLTGKVRVSP